jgi:hypothetical protein
MVVIIAYIYFLLVCFTTGLSIGQKDTSEFVATIVNGIFVLPLIGRVIGWW